MYQIIEVTGENVTKSIRHELNEVISSPGTSGVFKTEDDYGTSYYYRGAVENNYLEFADMCWRVVRVVGDGSIKLVLYNYNPNSVANPCDTSQDEPSAGFARYSGTTHTSAFNTYGGDAKNVGYMYSPSGTIFSTSRAQATTNSVSSTIKTNLDAWYTNKLNSYSGNISDTLWCNDRQTAKELGYNDGYQDTGLGYGANKTYYAAEYRLSITKTPTLKCGQKNDRFTVSDTVIGNGNLSNPVGLLTADEIAYAGGVYGNYNTDYYLSKNVTNEGSRWWAFTPIDARVGGSYSSVYLVSYEGYLGRNGVTADINSIRPAVTLKSTTKITGLGTSSNPYKLI